MAELLKLLMPKILGVIDEKIRRAIKQTQEYGTQYEHVGGRHGPVIRRYEKPGMRDLKAHVGRLEAQMASDTVNAIAPPSRADVEARRAKGERGVTFTQVMRSLLEERSAQYSKKSREQIAAESARDAVLAARTRGQKGVDFKTEYEKRLRK